MLGHAIAPRKLHRHARPCIPVRFGGLRFGNQHALDAIGAIEQRERLAHGIRTLQPEGIEHGQLPFELGFEQLARDRKPMLGMRKQRLRSAKACIVQAADRSRQDRCRRGPVG